jgi:hypothetical protein
MLSTLLSMPSSALSTPPSTGCFAKDGGVSSKAEEAIHVQNIMFVALTFGEDRNKIY